MKARKQLSGNVSRALRFRPVLPRLFQKSGLICGRSRLQSRPEKASGYVETALPDVESLVPDRRSPRSKLQEIRQIFRRRMSPSPRQRQEATSLQPLQPQPPQIPSPEKAVKGTSPRQQAPAVKTKEACLCQQTVTPAESPNPRQA